MLHAIPELNTDATRPYKTIYDNTVEQNNGNVGESTLDVRNPHTWVALKHIFSQLAEITPGPYIHVGGDETHSTPHADFQAFVKQVIPIVRDLDKQAIGWNEFADAGLSEGDIDHYYNWNPLTVVRPPSADMPLVEESDIIGMEGPMWSETIRRGTQNEFMMFPRAMSHAEIGWTPQAQRDYDSFAKRMEPMGARLLAKGSNFYDTPKVQWDTDAAGTDAKSAPGQQMLVEPAVVVAPGTIVSEDGRSIAVDNVNDEDGTSNSELTAMAASRRVLVLKRIFAPQGSGHYNLLWHGSHHPHRSGRAMHVTGAQ